MYRLFSLKKLVMLLTKKDLKKLLTPEEQKPITRATGRVTYKRGYWEHEYVKCYPVDCYYNMITGFCKLRDECETVVTFEGNICRVTYTDKQGISGEVAIDMAKHPDKIVNEFINAII